MTRQPDENRQLTGLLQALATPEPSAEFLAGARRRYLEAIDARDRRAVFTGLAAALTGLAVIGALLTTLIEPAAIVVGVAEAMADVARWLAGAGAVVALVPAVIWSSAALSSVAALLCLILIMRARSLAEVK